MPGRARGRFKNLDDHQRETLAEYLGTRIDYLRAERKYTQLVLDALQTPARGDNKRIRSFVSQVLAPTRERMRAAQLAAITESADIDRLSELIPTVLSEVTQAIDVPMLFAAMNIDTDLTDQAVTRATPLIRRITSRVPRSRRAAG